jgi:hypothetical protein
MAKMLFTAAVGDARGKLGGFVFGSRGARAILLPKTTPRNPLSEPQAALRRHLRLLGWRWTYYLIQGQRDDWNSFASTYDFTDLFSRTYHLSGWGMFVKVNQTLKLVSAPLLDDPPADLACTSPTGPVLVIAGAPPTLEVTLTNAPAANERVYLAAARPLSQGALQVGKLSRKMKHFGTAVPGPYPFTTEYQTKYGTLRSGQRITALINFICLDTGGQGTPALAQEVVP